MSWVWKWGMELKQGQPLEDNGERWLCILHYIYFLRLWRFSGRKQFENYCKTRRAGSWEAGGEPESTPYSLSRQPHFNVACWSYLRPLLLLSCICCLRCCWSLHTQMSYYDDDDDDNFLRLNVFDFAFCSCFPLFCCFSSLQLEFSRSFFFVVRLQMLPLT